MSAVLVSRSVTSISLLHRRINHVKMWLQCNYVSGMNQRENQNGYNWFPGSAVRFPTATFEDSVLIFELAYRVRAGHGITR